VQRKLFSRSTVVKGFYSKGKNSVITHLNKRSFAKNNRSFVSSLLFVFVLIAGFMPQEQAFSIDFAAQKSVLLQKLDSLDMEKQIRKRKGQSIEDLEKLSATIKDSITGVKKELALANGQPAAVPNPDVHGPAGMQQYFKDFRKYLPQNTFDWIVVVVGFVAIIAGVILCIGLFGMAWKKVFRKKKSSLKTMHDIFPQPAGKSDAGSLSKSGGADTEARDRRVDFLRQRIKEESVGSPSAGPGLGAVQPNIQGETAADSAGLKNRIISAAEEGADISEISKKFHVSTDQVSLILRIARQEKETDR
jgi:hypothetical protein